MSEMFKIKNENGLFSSGGIHVQWRENGRMWDSIGALKRHISLFLEEDGTPQSDYPYKNSRLVIVKFEEMDCEPINKVVEDIKFNRNIAEQRRQKSINKKVEQKEREELSRLLNKYGE